ncbi:hypothetical protein LTR62_006044 [Meristemomyces frigidus]|uniref:Uncharacterized protein n=1 Tax=Meristemomyces frigidus TaxID=1508187 RepID=A0AAN7TKA6_9PEZI|nr:hypothetical protein LTR62_006044 [Meristemomyces frigidus]
MAIANGTRGCLDLLQKLGETDKVPSVGRVWPQDQAARLNLWAASLGVFADGHLSVEYRLRLNDFVFDIVLQLLAGLYDCLDLLSTRLDLKDAGQRHTEDYAVEMTPEASEPDETEYALPRRQSTSTSTSSGDDLSAAPAEELRERIRPDSFQSNYGKKGLTITIKGQLILTRKMTMETL